MVRSLNGSKSVVGRSPNIFTTKVFSNGDIANAFNVQYTSSRVYSSDKTQSTTLKRTFKLSLEFKYVENSELNKSKKVRKIFRTR